MEIVSTGAARPIRGVRRPGLLSLAPGVERYVVPGRSARAIRIAGGDIIRLVNPEGGQPCELVCVADDGRLRRTCWVRGQGEALPVSAA